jgi:hypothetical protein
MPSVLKDWVMQLTLAEQGTLLTVVRGPDNIRKDHPTKMFIRAFRRCMLNGAKPPDATMFMTPKGYLTQSEVARLAIPNLVDDGTMTDPANFDILVKFWEANVDDVPHHWLMHFVHCCQIAGHYHPDLAVRGFWWDVYHAITDTFHMTTEMQDKFRHRLRDRGCY